MLCFTRHFENGLRPCNLDARGSFQQGWNGNVDAARTSNGRCRAREMREQRMKRKQLVKLLHAYRSAAKRSLQSRRYDTRQRAKGRMQLIERLLTKLEVRRVKQEI